MQRSPHSHKGDNGKVAIIGGSRHIHGAPIFNALAAEASGIDTLSICLPQCHEDTAKHWMLNAFVHPFHGNTIANEDIEPILELIAPLDCIVIGSGIARTGERIAALEEIIASCTTPMVLDATALQANTLDLVRGKQAILTPHLGELERMGIEENDLQDVANEYQTIIVLKGEVDRVVSGHTSDEISGGNAGLTTGGTGDVLAGLIAGLVAQGLAPLDAARDSCIIMKKAGEKLQKDYGFSYTALDTIRTIPSLLKNL
ncbi:NAD(P)H-hydrate dehydratase [Candidatus Peregrinibacteria bacterium CG10_big_fil_rev_8_21_14_0_10_42_8]|nr:MAG: NAD(P)H-hydrate dehydratase [Candidatus Peregrinibacteria bacterium CG10_big_fil_rev_8_21_14_0_10_42_8]